MSTPGRPVGDAACDVPASSAIPPDSSTCGCTASTRSPTARVRIDDAVAAAAADAMPALALTDLGNVFGLVKFYQAARAARREADHRLRRLGHARRRARPAVPPAAARADRGGLPAPVRTGCRAPTAATSTAGTPSCGAAGSPKAPTD